MTNDEILSYLIENGVLSVRWQQPIAAHKSKPLVSVAKPETPYPLIKFRKGLITKSELCEELKIQKEDLLRYLIEHRELFNFS